ncbi:MAG TPA: glycosyl hydrolase family 28-related protein, partial [Thermomicrobiales bacterium]
MSSPLADQNPPATEVEIKAAIDAVDAAGGGVVRLLPGTDNFSSSISCTLLNHYNNISIVGSGRGATILKAVANNVSIFAFGNGDANSGIVPKNLHFAQMTLDMNNTTGAAYGMAIACCQDVTMDNLHFKNQKNGAKSMLFFGVTANASGALIPR